MGDLSTTSLLLVVNAYVLLALLLFGLSASDLICRLKQGIRCAKRRRVSKFSVALPLMLSCLALLAMGVFAIGMAHGSRPKDYQVVLFILGCLVPFFLLIVWVFGSLWVDGLWVAATTTLFIYLSCINPAIYIQYWADDNWQWAQMWTARHYETGGGGLQQMASSARKWYKRAAVNGNEEAQYKVAQSERRSKNAKKWYLMAAEQGHVGAMVQVARLASNKDERKRWLDRAVSKRHPEALFMKMKDIMNTDLPAARKLLLEAAEKRSRAALVLLINQYQQGGILFDQDSESADHWQTVLQNTPVSDTSPKHLNTITFNQSPKQTQDFGEKISSDEPETLFKQAKIFLNHPGKDQILHDRAIDYLTRAADKGHGEAALELARQAMKKDPAEILNKEALQWFERAAMSDNPYALKTLSKYYKEMSNATLTDLKKSLEYNTRLLNIPQKNTTRTRLERQHWSGEYRDTQKKIEQLKRLGGSWQEAKDLAEKSPEKEYHLAQELLKSRQYKSGMQRMQSAAERGNPEARYELARRTLNGPRSFMQEINAVSEIQHLAKEGFASAILRLGMLYQSGTGLVPKNIYLGRQLFHQLQTNDDLSEKALRILDRTPTFTDNLQLHPYNDNPHQTIQSWYEQVRRTAEDQTLFQQQYEALLDHFSDIGKLRQQAVKNDAESQYRLAQTLQSHDLKEAMHWLKRAAINGSTNAQYELAVRMIRGKKNPPETKKALKKWAVTAADNGHVGAMIFAAIQFKNGYGGFEKNSALAKHYYTKALQSTDTAILFKGKIAGKSLAFKRSTIKKALETLSK